MFEKEAEDYSIDTYETCLYDNLPYTNDSRAREESFRDGATFGYNKANEWHFVKDGDIPKDEDYKLCITDDGNYYIARYEELFVHWSNQEYKEVCCPYAWKEIVPPKESEK